MATTLLSQSQVLATTHDLPAFPRVIDKILTSLDDADASINVLVDHVEHDPVVAGHVLSLANRAGSFHGKGHVDDVFTAISLLGLARVREVAELVSMASFMQGWIPAAEQQAFWAHSMAVAVCGVEIAHSTHLDVSVDASLLSGLMHDVGQLWLQRFRPAEFARCQQLAHSRGCGIEVAEQEQFGVDHGTIGAWLASSWDVGQPIAAAIAYHHTPENKPGEALVAVTHVAEVLCSALDLTESDSSRVTRISPASCNLLGLDWGPDARRLFGRIEARNRFARGLFEA